MKVFIAGPRAIRMLSEDVKRRLYNIYDKNIDVIVGDANGIDKAVQAFFKDLNYKNVHVYATEGKARNNIGNWNVHAVSVPKPLKGFDYYVAKDKVMVKDADYGLMLWNGESRGTLNNIINLAQNNKKTVVYFTPDGEFHNISTVEQLEKMISLCDNEIRTEYRKLSNKLMAEKNIQYNFFNM